jgi:hypothetical protein
MVVTVVAMVAAAGMANAEGGLAFSVRPGLLINATQVGYKTDNFFIGGGLEFASASWSNSYESVQHDTTVFPETTYTYKYGSKIGASVFLPQVAAKYFWGGAAAADKDGGYARPFVGASVFYSIASINVTMTDDDSTYKAQPRAGRCRTSWTAISAAPSPSVASTTSRTACRFPPNSASGTCSATPT